MPRIDEGADLKFGNATLRLQPSVDGFAMPFSGGAPSIECDKPFPMTVAATATKQQAIRLDCRTNPIVQKCVSLIHREFRSESEAHKESELSELA